MTEKHEDSPQGALADVINTAIPTIDLNGDGSVFSISGPMRTSVLLENDAYKNVPINGGQEFMMSKVYIGARDTPNFCFTPVDAQPYKQVEFAEKKVFEAFPHLEGTLVKILLNHMGDTEGPTDAPWELTKKVFFKWHAKQLAGAAAAIKKTVEKTYGDNPNWGLF